MSVADKVNQMRVGWVVKQHIPVRYAAIVDDDGNVMMSETARWPCIWHMVWVMVRQLISAEKR